MITMIWKDVIVQILHNENLKKYTNVKIGGTAKIMYFPESKEELINLINELKGKHFYIISGGSNILMNDQKEYGNVISLKKIDKTITHLGNGQFFSGASVGVQKLINEINKEGYYGIEYLFSVPALVGGAIVMNAGRGRAYNECISDFIEEVHVYHNGTTKVLRKEECRFSYRDSIFKNNDYIVLGAKFKFVTEPKQTKKERMEFSKKYQDYSASSFGSVFCEHDRKIMYIVRLIHPGYKNGMAFSNKTSNWLLNKGEGTYAQAIKLIKRVQKFHKMFGKRAKPEVIIWK